MQLLLKKDFCKPPITSKDKNFDYEVFIEELPTFLKKELELYDELWDYLYTESLNGGLIDIDFGTWEKDLAQSLANVVKDIEVWVNSYHNTTKSWKKTKILPI